jgi:hypothetical protein
MDWTGTSTTSWSGGTHGFNADGRMPYSAQGNILTGPACVLQSERGFLEEPTMATKQVTNETRDARAANTAECFDLPARLMRALLAGAANGQGDTRCTRRAPPVPVDSAYIRVDLASGEPWLLLSVTDTYPLSAVDVLYAEYLVWRALNPCADGTGLRAFRNNASALARAKEGAEKHRLRAEAILAHHAAAHENLILTV